MALRVWLPLNGNLNNQGLSNIIPSGTPTFLDSGKMGKCISIAQRVSFTKLPKLDKFTVLFWLKVDSCSVDWADSLSFTSKQTDGSSAAPFRFEATTSSRACSFHNNSPYAITQGSRILITSTQWGQWHHCGVSYDGANLYTYIDGVLTYTDTGLGGYLIDYFHIGETNNIVGGMNDLRIYDECLSQKQIKEISKGLVAHYKLDNPYIETATNLVPGINGTTAYSTNTSPAWDTELNGTPMINPSGWGNGYNGGVTDPTHGYHAHWIRENGQWEMIFPNLNSVISQKGRWEGISSGVSTKDILAGEKYTISWWQKTDNLNLAAWGGIYYKKTSDASWNFYDGCPTLGYNTKLNTWQFMYKTFTRSSEYIQHDGGQSIYVYGGNSNEGTMYVKDVQIVRGDHPLPYTVGTKNGQNYEQDCSGNGHIATPIGTCSYSLNTSRYGGSTLFTSSNIGTSTITGASFLTGKVGLTAPNALTVSFWGKVISYNYQNSGIIGLTQNTYPSDLSNDTINQYDGNFRINANSGNYCNLSALNLIVLNEWHLYTITFDGTAAKSYRDGILIETKSLTGPLKTFSRAILGLSQAGGAYRQTTAYWSDFRIYATALSADDILTIYKNSGIIDNKGNVYAYEFREE